MKKQLGASHFFEWCKSTNCQTIHSAEIQFLFSNREIKTGMHPNDSA